MRIELQIPLDFLREGDTLVVTRIDRLARSMKELQDIVYELKGRGVYKGGKARIDPDAVRKLVADGMKPAHIARQLGISRGTVYKFMPKPLDSDPM